MASLQLTDRDAEASLLSFIGDDGFFWSSLVFFFCFFFTEMLGLKCFEVTGYCIEIRLLSF